MNIHFNYNSEKEDIGSQGETYQLPEKPITITRTHLPGRVGSNHKKRIASYSNIIKRFARTILQGLNANTLLAMFKNAQVRYNDAHNHI